MSGQLTPAKRQHDRNEPNSRGKWQKTASNSQNLRIPPGTSFFRVLCPASKGGSVIGKGGGIISQIRQETGAKVRVEETVPGCDERIIVIIESDKENGGGSEQNKVEDEEKNATDEVDNPDEQEKEGEDKESLATTDKESDAAKDSQCEKGPSAAQKALLLVFERIAEGEPEADGGNEENDKASAFSLRLLVLSSQAGCILEKGGSVIKQMESESGAQIRILPSDKLPVCASSSDELVQISESLDTIRKALLCVSQQLLEHPPRDDELLSLNTSGASSHSSGHPFPRQEPNYPFTSQGPPYVGLGPRDSGSGILGRMNPSQDILTFKLLCPDEKAGGVIGKGGSIVKALQHESGCEIKVLEGLSGSEDRVIIISGPAHPDDRISAPQDAALRVQTRIVRAAPEGKEKTVMAKILVASNQIGCLLGKGGAVISEMRKFTGAYIRILGKDQIPKCASENEEVVQITDACSACFEQRTVFTQQVLAKALNQMVDQTPLPMLFMTVIQATDAFPTLVDFVMEILLKLVGKQVWRMPKLWVGFLKCVSQTQPHSFRVLLQLPSPQLEGALKKFASLRGPLAAYANQPSIKTSLPRATVALLGLANEKSMQQPHRQPSLHSSEQSSSIHGATPT